VADEEVERPFAAHFSLRVVLADGGDIAFAIGAQVRIVPPGAGLQCRNANLPGHVVFRADHMAHKIVPVAAAAARSLPQLIRYLGAHLVEIGPGGLHEREVVFQCGVGHGGAIDF